jgi:hydrogenase large subunit
VNLGEAAEYMFDHNIFQENLVGVDFCEKMVAETQPGVLERANRTESPTRLTTGTRRSATSCDRSTRSPVSSTGRRCRSVDTRDVLPDGGAPRAPSTLYPGGVGAPPPSNLFTDYYIRLMRYVSS